MSSIAAMLIAYGAAGGGGPSDPFFSNVVALMNPTAADGSTSFSDAKGKVYTRTGTAIVEDSIAQFNGSCVDVGSGSFTSPDNTDWNILAGGDFTVEALVVFPIVPSGNIDLFKRNPAASTNWILRPTATGLSWVYPGVISRNITKTWLANTLHHIHGGRSGTTTYVGVDGVTTSFTGSNPTTDSAGTLQIGANTGSAQGRYVAFRITKGLCRYTGAYTPPTAPFPTH